MADIVFPSDALSPLRDLIADLILLNPQFGTFLRVPRQCVLVIDASDIMADLHWRARHCQDPSARMPLQEAIDSHTVIAIAPQQLLHEVTRKIPEYAQKWEIDEEVLWQEWLVCKGRLRFYDIGPTRDVTDQSFRDPTDLPYIDLYSQSGADAIVSADKDIPAMGAKTVGRETKIALRDYARAESGVLHIKLGGLLVTIIITESMTAIWSLAVALARAFVRLPVWLQLVILAAIGAGAIHPRSRTMLGELVSNRSDDFGALATMIRSVVGSTFQTFAIESVKLADAERRVSEALPEHRRQPPLESVVYSVCYAAGEPLSVREIARAVLKRGYQSRSRTFLAYLLQVLSKSERFVCGTDGLWAVGRQNLSS